MSSDTEPTVDWSDFPTFRLVTDGPTAQHVKELKLGGIDLLPLFVTDVQISLPVNGLATVSLTFEVVPDIDLGGAAVNIIGQLDA